MSDKKKAVRCANTNGLEQKSNDYLHSTTGDPRCQVLQPLHGKIAGDTWRKMASISKHLLRKPEGWAVDLGDLNRAAALGARFVEIFDLENKITYKASMATMQAKGQKIDRAFGVQVVLPLKHWSNFIEESRETEPLQLKLGVPHE